MKDTSHVALVIAVALIVGAAGFFVGVHVANRRLTGAWGNERPMMGQRMGMMRGRGSGGYGTRSGGMMGAGGQITAISGNTVTLKATNGTTSTVILSDGAVVDTMTKGTAKDLKVGQNILVTGGGFWNGAETVIVRPQ